MGKNSLRDILIGGSVASILAALPGTAIGAAWTRDSGEFLFVVPTTYFYADEQFDDDGDRVDRPRFEQFEVSPYMEYGLTDFLTAGAQPKYRWVDIETANGDVSNNGLAETDAFLRLRLWESGEAAFSIQGLAKIPIEPDEGDPAPLGRDQVDGEIRVLFGNRHPVGFGKIFYNAELGYRKRWEDPSDQVHADGFIGWTGGPWTFLVQSLNTIGLSDDEDGVEVLTAQPDFTRYAVQLAAAYRVSETFSLVGGASTAYAGTNIGAGISGFVAALVRF